MDAMHRDEGKIARAITAGLSRRHFLRASSAAALAALSASEPRLLAGSTRIAARADSLILLWMAGGMAQTETFDPKRYTPFAPGLESKRVLSTFPAINTAVDNIKISAGLERIAKIMDRGTLIRSHRVGDLGFILHSRHQYHWHTGYPPPQSVAAPHMGAVISRTLGPRNPEMPAFIDIGQNLEIGGESDAVKAFHTAGFLGSEHAPFLIADPRDAVARVRPSEHIGSARFRRRYEEYKSLVAAGPVGQYGSDFQRESLLRSIDNAHRLLNSPAARAFDLSLEPRASYDIYNTGRFGLGCLLARRLVESGARFVEVTTEYIPFRYWDTHENGHKRTVGMKESIDGPVSQLIVDLEARGLLDRTLVVLASEFGRDMITEGKPGAEVKQQVKQPDIMTEPKHYGMHRHFTEAGSVLMFGGGSPRGKLHGRTADERPCRIVEDPVTIDDLHATIYTAMGIAPDTAYEVEKAAVLCHQGRQREGHRRASRLIRLKDLRMQKPRQDLQRLNQSRPRTIEILIAVRHPDLPEPHRRQIAPAGPARQPMHFAGGAPPVKAAGHNQDGVGGRGGQFLPRAPRYKLGARQGHQFRHPVGRRHQGLDPLDAGQPRPVCIAPHGVGNQPHAFLQARHKLLAARPDIQRSGDAPHVFPDIPERCGIQRHHHGPAGQARRYGALHIVQAYSTDLAMNLGQDMGRLQAFQHIVENLIDGQRFAPRLANQAIDLPAVAIHGETRRGTRRQPAHGFRIVALVRAPHQPRKRAQGVHNLRGARDHGNDARRHTPLLAGSRSANRNPSASWNSPGNTGIGCRNIGPA